MIDKTLKALERLMPLFEKSMRELVFTAEKAGEVTADMNTLRAAMAAPVVEDAQTEVPPEVQLTPEEAAILKRALWKSVKVLAPAPTQPPTQLDTDSDDAKGLAAPPGYWHGHNAAQDVLASVMETELATYRAEVVALIGRGAALEAEVERLRIALATVTTRPPSVEAEPVPGQAAAWQSHGENTGMRHPEQSDLGGGETDCHAPEQAVAGEMPTEGNGNGVPRSE